jgi:hypothetical protein
MRIKGQIFFSGKYFLFDFQLPRPWLVSRVELTKVAAIKNIFQPLIRINNSM